jgi:hypothetical protein
MSKKIVKGEVAPETSSEISKKDQLIKELQAEEEANLRACSQEVGIALQKYGYELFIDQSIKIRKAS